MRSTTVCLLLLICCLLVASCIIVRYSPAPSSGTILRWIDGDTLEIIVDDCTIPGWTERVRVYGVDTPERGEPGFDEATEASRARWPEGMRVTLVYPETSKGITRYRDNFGRLLAVPEER